MQGIAEMFSNGGVFAYVVLLLGIIALPLSIVALIIALVSRKRKIGLIFGLLATGVSALTFLSGLLGYVIGMGEAEGAIAGGAVMPEQIVPMASRAVGIASPVLGMGAFLAGLPFVLGVLALCRAAARPATPPDEQTADAELAGKLGSKGAAVVSAILPGASLILCVGFLIVSLDGPQGLARMMSESGGLGMLQLLFYVLAIVAISFLAPKAARGRRMLVAPLLLLASLPWLAGFSTVIFGGADALNAMEYAAPDARAAMLARGISVSINAQSLGAITSAWLLLMVGLSLALGARGLRAEGRSGTGFLFGALAGIPLLLLAGLALAGGGLSAVLVAIGAILGLVIAMLGGSAMGDDGPLHRSVSLGLGAALAAGLACAALCFAAASTVTITVFSALESAAPDQRARVLVHAADEASLVWAARDFGWLIALLPAAVLVVLGLKRTGISSGRVAGAILLALVFALGPALNLIALSALELPPWARTQSPWAATDPSFRPPVVGPLGCKLGGEERGVDAHVGITMVTVQERPVGNLADPNSVAQLQAGLAEALNLKRALAARRGFGTPYTLRIEVDDGLPASYLTAVLRTAHAAGASKVELVGVESTYNPVDPAPVVDLHPLLAVYAMTASGRTCALPVQVGAPPMDGMNAPIWSGVIGAADELDLALTKGAPGPGGESTKRLRIPRPYSSDLYGLTYDAWSPGDEPKGYALLSADQTVTTGKMILAASAVYAEGMVPYLAAP